MASLESIKELTPEALLKLQETGITDTDTFLSKAATPKDRKALAEATQIDPAVLLRCANLADLCRIKGIGREYADLLEAVGVDTVPELAQRNPESLYQKIVDVNAEKKLVSLMPTLELVQNWIRQAKELPRILSYS